MTTESTNTVQMINKRVIDSSIYFSIAITIFALITGVLSSSKLIIFDGIKNLLGAVFTIPSIIAIKFIKKQDNVNYPFGKEAIEPIVAIVQYCALIYICITNINYAIKLILDGGYMIIIKTGIFYGFVSTIFKIGAYIYLKTLTKKHSTAIAEAEVVGWLFESIVGVGILLGFIFSWLLSIIDKPVYMPYIDPILNVIISLIFGIIPLMAIKDCVKELLLAKPKPEIISLIDEKIEKVSINYNFDYRTLRLAKIGGKLIIEIDYVIKEGSKLDSVYKQDQLRSQLEVDFSKLPYTTMININFTGKG
ncbi:MAG: cation transporter [Oscillospiraceae bacterium]|nr:cation transporter [Oscillospiraceae bacterium]